MSIPSPSSAQTAAHQVVLALEASGDSVSVALLQNGICAVFKEHYARFGHAEHLVGMVADGLTEAGVAFSDLTHIAAGCGPGSFTGLRVCLSAAKGYALATRARPVGIAGLAALALHAVSDSQPEPGPLSPVVCFADTRRQSVFVQEFDSQARAKSSVSDIPLDQLSGWLDKIYERNEETPVYLSGLTDQISDHVRRHKGLICLKQPVNAAMIARYAVLSLGAPADYPHTGFSPLYVVAPKLGPAKQNA